MLKNLSLIIILILLTCHQPTALPADGLMVRADNHGVETVNYLRLDEVAVVVVHAWDTRGHTEPGYFFGTPAKNAVYQEHARQMLVPFLARMRAGGVLIVYTLSRDNQLNPDLPDGLIYHDEWGYPGLRSLLRDRGIRAVLLAGYAADACLVSTTGGYRNLRHDFNVFVVGDGTLALWSSPAGPETETAAAVRRIGRVLAVTRTDWVEWHFPHR